MDIRTSIEDEIGQVRLAGAADGNRLSQDLVIRLGNALAHLAANDGIKAVVLSAEGQDFCLGRVGGPGAGVPTPLDLQKQMMRPILDVYRALRAIEVPVIALVRGQANGFGAALAASADITIASQNARFSFSEIKSDMPPTLAMATVMERAQLKGLAWMVYTAQAVSAQEALTIGLVSRVVADEALESAGAETLALLLERRRAALAGAKRFLAEARLHDFTHAAEYGSQLLSAVLASR